ncbi:exosortase/archaeosortase family protein [Colwellia chukchiensis]|uniref:Exosortase/archaeosortase family protein n=1 Tax=Colwellia chukchiensis TaxID=641665 RepID=A0A1H7GQE2_9GAMM|nr:archaeosortase/exosortase family protein [Colwellia chukchiensis]SEK40386.1 exosortase/archaeosortase family protein [Colwellia chukchiensis]
MVTLSANHNASALLRFFPRFVVVLILLQFIVLAIHTSSVASTLIQHWLTQAVAYIHQLLGTAFTVNGNVLTHQQSLQYVIVDNQCTGLMLLASVWAAIIGFARSLLKTLKMLIFAVIILQAINVLRITHLFFEIGQANNNFEFYHLYFWQTVNFISAVVVLFFLEKKFSCDRERHV